MNLEMAYKSPASFHKITYSLALDLSKVAKVVTNIYTFFNCDLR